ncbi:MAG TPA: ABC transporter ATP-binding protein [Acidimicrobiia bacterium]
MRHRFPSDDGPIPVLDGIDADIAPGEFVSLVGPSGCGKTTLMNMVAGLVKPSEGEVLLNGVESRQPSRSVGYMFARDRLMPWRTALGNVEFGPEVRGVPLKQRRQRAREMLALVGLAGFEDAYPAELSQGMRQRVAMARTLIIDPSVMLLDEPFAALDAQTRTLLQREFLRIWTQFRPTVLFVTHDLEEAVFLADRVLVMSARPGRIKAEFRVPIPRPRDVAEMKFDEEARRIAREVWSVLKDEVVLGDGAQEDAT